MLPSLVANKLLSVSGVASSVPALLWISTNKKSKLVVVVVSCVTTFTQNVREAAVAFPGIAMAVCLSESCSLSLPPRYPYAVPACGKEPPLMTVLWPEILVVPVQPGAELPDAVACSKPPSAISCTFPPPPPDVLTVRDTVAVRVTPAPVPVTVTE